MAKKKKSINLLTKRFLCSGAPMHIAQKDHSSATASESLESLVEGLTTMIEKQFMVDLISFTNMNNKQFMVEQTGFTIMIIIIDG